MIGFGKKLKSLRLSRSMTMQQVAQLLGVAKSSYAGYESEFRHPSLDKLCVLAQYYHVSVDYILGLTENQESEEVKQQNAERKLLIKGNELHWDGIVLTQEECQPIMEVLERVSKQEEVPLKQVDGK